MSARVEPAAEPVTGEAPREIARAIWGLVDDAYGLAARTPSLSQREAHDLCREADVGDPPTEVEDALAFLHVPRWGYVCARLFTNADRDSSGRAALVSDVVSVAPATFAALRHDPFRCFPPRRADRRPEQRGELSTPALTPMSESAEASLLARLMEKDDAAALLRPLLGALLEGDRVLWLSAPPPQAALQALVLLLPVPLRPALTFQTLAVDRPKHAPRLTCAPRRTAELNEQRWSRELPRQADQIEPRALRAADAVLASARDQGALAGAHAMYDHYARAAAARPAADLLAETERLARFLALHHAVRRGAPADAVGTLVPDAAPAERSLVIDVLVDAFAPARLAADLAAMLRRPDGDHAAAAAVVVELARRLRPPDHAFAALFGPLVRQLDGWVPAVTADAHLQRARVVLAAAAAWLADPNALVTWATPDAAWDDAAAAIGRPVLDAAVAPARAPLAALVAAAQAPDADAAAGVAESLGRVLPQLSHAARPRAAALALAVVRRAFRERAQVADGGAAAARAADTLLRLWSHEPPDADGVVFRTLLTAAHGGSGGNASRIASAVHAAILTGTGGGADAGALGENELLAWVAVLVSRAAAGEPAPATLDQAARLMEYAPRLGRDEGARSQQLGRLLLATFPHGAPLSSEWIDFLRYCDAGVRRQLLLRALEQAAAAEQGGGLAAFTEACAVLADAGVTLDADAIALLRPSLQRVIGTLGVSPGAAVRLTGLVAVLGALADADGAAALVRQLLEKVPNGLQKPLRLRRLAGALAEVEQARDEDAHAELRELLRDVSNGHHVPLPIPATDERLLRDFLGMPAEPLGERVRGVFGRARKRAPGTVPVPLENNP